MKKLFTILAVLCAVLTLASCESRSGQRASARDRYLVHTAFESEDNKLCIITLVMDKNYSSRIIRWDDTVDQTNVKAVTQLIELRRAQADSVINSLIKFKE